ncbi:MAG: transglycosylase domain-containing protein [Cyclobacteriaceae bacterium]|nr:transglycosylase domain-containing protein [Cyclobacteriaceae bacterium]
MKGLAVHFLNRIYSIATNLHSRLAVLPRPIRTALLAAGGFFLFGAMFLLLIWAGAFGNIPSRHDLSKINHPVATEVYSADSVLLGKYYLVERSMVPSVQIPTTLKQALVATEDVRFYTHHGVDTRSMLRVLVKGIFLQQESAGGGSTLTQQLAKNLYPRRSYLMLSLLINKIREIIIAKRLEKVYSKDEILVLYLNTVPFGDNVYGIKTAADRFFSIPVDRLTLDQSAVLIGMLKATYRYNPRLFPERALERRNVVLSQLEKYHFINATERDTYMAKPLQLNYHRMSHNAGLAPYFRAFIKTELLSWCRTHEKPDGSPYNLYTDGLKVYTTIDSRLQQYAESAIRSQLTQLQEKFLKQLDKKVVQEIAKGKIQLLPAYKRMKKEGFSEKDILSVLKTPAKKHIFAWKGSRDVEISTYDSLLYHLQFLQAGLLAMDPATGDVKAWVGGINHEFFQYDHVRESTKRQVGSTFKPIVYAAAMEQGVSPCDYTSARKTAYSNMDDWTPQNTEADSYDQRYSMEGSLAKSVNTVSVKLLEKTGISNAITVANKMGIKSKLPPVPSLALGTASISVIEMVGAYSVFANKGNYVPPGFITSITTNRGVMLENFRIEPTVDQAISEETAAMMLYMLKRVVNEGTGAGIRTKYGLKNDIAGKTGTTQANADGWFMAITPKLVIGCWVGADDPGIHFKTTADGQGAATALPIVAQLLQKVNKDHDLGIIATARFEPLEDRLVERLDCDMSRSDRNLFQRIFNLKKGTKETTFKVEKNRNAP